jgi:hypothetical protein
VVGLALAMVTLAAAGLAALYWARRRSVVHER